MKPADVEAYARYAWEPEYVEHARRFVSSLGFEVAGTRALDLAAGAGPYTAALVEAGAAHVTWHDREPLLEAVARERIGPDAPVDYRVADLLALDDAPGTFDLVLIVEALHWASDEPELYRRLARVVAPGGHLVIEGLGPGRVLRAAHSPLRRVAHLASPLVALVLRRKVVPTLWVFPALTRRRIRRAGFELDRWTRSGYHFTAVFRRAPSPEGSSAT